MVSDNFSFSKAKLAIRDSFHKPQDNKRRQTLATLKLNIAFSKKIEKKNNKEESMGELPRKYKSILIKSSVFNPVSNSYFLGNYPSAE